MFNNGKQIPAYGNEKTPNIKIMELQDKNANLRLALGNFLKVCKEFNTEYSEYFNQCIKEAQKALDEN